MPTVLLPAPTSTPAHPFHSLSQPANPIGGRCWMNGRDYERGTTPQRRHFHDSDHDAEITSFAHDESHMRAHGSKRVVYARKRWRRRDADPDLSKCETAEKAISLAYQHIDTLSPRRLSSFWTQMSKFLSNRDDDDDGDGPAVASSRHGCDHMQSRMRNQLRQLVRHQLERLLACTLKRMKKIVCRDLAQQTLALGKIVNILGNDSRRHPNGSPGHVLRHLLVGENSVNKHRIFRRIAVLSTRILPKFDPLHLSDLIYAYGLAGYDPSFDDGTTFFDLVAYEAVPKLGVFGSRDLSNAVWSYANAGSSSNPRLFKEAGDVLFVRARGDTSEFFAPRDFSDVAWAYATAKETHPEMFERLVDDIVALGNVSDFKPREISNLVWAFATVGESHPRLFGRVAGHIVALDNLNVFKRFLGEWQIISLRGAI